MKQAFPDINPHYFNVFQPSNSTVIGQKYQLTIERWVSFRLLRSIA